MTRIDFYFNAEDKLQVACRLAGKAYAQRKRLLIYAPEGDSAQRIDRMLWTWQALSFVPHCAAQDSLASQTPVLIASSQDVAPDCDLLLNLSVECPPHFERFERMLEIVARDDEEKKLGRSRYRFYRERGYPISDHDLAAGTPA